eukprot:159354_1
MNNNNMMNNNMMMPNMMMPNMMMNNMMMNPNMMNMMKQQQQNQNMNQQNQNKNQMNQNKPKHRPQSSELAEGNAAMSHYLDNANVNGMDNVAAIAAIPSAYRALSADSGGMNAQSGDENEEKDYLPYGAENENHNDMDRIAEPEPVARVFSADSANDWQKDKTEEIAKAEVEIAKPALDDDDDSQIADKLICMGFDTNYVMRACKVHKKKFVSKPYNTE